MTDALHKELKLERYHQLVESALAERVPMALCDAQGDCVWASDGDAPNGISTLLTALIDAGFRWELDLEGRPLRNADNERVLLYEELRLSGRSIGRLALLVPRSAIEASRDGLPRVLRTLRATAACVIDDYALQRESQSLATELAQRYEELNLVYALESFSGVDDEALDVQPLLSRIVEHLGADLAAFITRGDREPAYVLGEGVHLPSLDLVLVALGGNLVRFVGADQRPLILNIGDPRREFLLPHMPYHVMACPVMRGDVGGVLVLLRIKPAHEFENSDRSLAQVIAEQMANTLRGHSILRNMREFGEQLAGALIEAVEAKDPYTRGHSERVQAIAVGIGRFMGLKKSDLADLYWGSIMHDVGKIGIPDVILCKPGRLTESEFTFIKTHPERSYEILRHVNYVTQNTLDGARYHHERFEGGGYPAGLSGQEIPVHARIIAIADAYDAMTSSRSYRAAMDHETAMREIERSSGTHLDPEICRAFVGSCQDDRAWLDRISFRTRRIHE